MIMVEKHHAVVDVGIVSYDGDKILHVFTRPDTIPRHFLIHRSDSQSFHFEETTPERLLEQLVTLFSLSMGTRVYAFRRLPYYGFSLTTEYKDRVIREIGLLQGNRRHKYIDI